MNMIAKLTTASLLLIGPTLADAGAVVVNQNSPLGPLNQDEVERIFMGRQSMVAGQPILVIFQASNTTRTDFEQRVLGKTGDELSSYWSMMIFTGRAKPPVDVAGDQGVKARLTASPGAIGYVSDEAVDSSMKVIFRY